MDKNDEIIRDTFLIAGNYYFSKEVKDYNTARHQYKIAHQLKKTPLSAFMILSCTLKCEENEESIDRADIYESIDDAKLVAEMSEYDKRYDDLIHIDGDISEVRFKLRRFMLNLKSISDPNQIEEMKKELNEFEKTVWKWMK